MEQLFLDFIDTAGTYQKGVFLMIAGLCFVFAVQLIIYIIVKIWPRPKENNNV